MKLDQLVDQAIKNGDYSKSEKEKRDHRNAIVVRAAKKRRAKEEKLDSKQSNGAT